uniref:Tyrosine-protein kinase ephrin type A/B receptor-like domain-containing protein n=1 Tax=Amphimedon queenslandica TaxID=400682 RepID=A0A1X7TQ81_AMPQE
MDSNLRTCTCSQGVSRENVTCDIASQNITHNGLLWIGTYDTSTPFNANATNPNACIINEDCLLYCSPNPVTFQLNDTDTQCADNRGQRMCGSCREGYSVLMGSSKCGQCHNNYMIIAWIALFAVMGVLLVVLLIALNLTVSVGTLNGLLFYANIVKLYEPVFSRKGALPVLSQVISWINLDFGFEICFYNGMDTYAKQWLQFAFPFYLWFVIIVIKQLCRRYGKHAWLFGFALFVSIIFVIPYTLFVLLNPFIENL